MFLNIKDYDEYRPKCIENGVKTWKPITENQIVEEEILITKKVESRGNIIAAKLRELETWSANDVFTEVVDYEQQKVSTRWAISEKLCNGLKVAKARLVARGFEEEGLNTIKTDSPTCSKESLRLIMAICSAYSWVCHSLSIKAAFLQGNSIEREVFLKSPSEANAKVLP